MQAAARPHPLPGTANCCRDCRIYMCHVCCGDREVADVMASPGLKAHTVRLISAGYGWFCSLTSIKSTGSFVRQSPPYCLCRTISKADIVCVTRCFRDSPVCFRFFPPVLLANRILFSWMRGSVPIVFFYAICQHFFSPLSFCCSCFSMSFF